jgi:hypothetical protein
MALALKEQFQIQIVPAFQAADGKRFHEAEEARSYTRDNMLNAVISAATKERPEFAKLDPTLLREFLLRVGKHVGAVMAEPLTPVDPNSPTVAVIKANVDSGDLAARLRRAAEENISSGKIAEFQPGQKMPQAANPDIFQNRSPVMQAADAVDADIANELRREFP